MKKRRRMIQNQGSIGRKPPAHYVYGQCQECKKDFAPALPKQYWCKSCRSAMWNSAISDPHVIVYHEPKAILWAATLKGLNYVTLARKVGLSDATIKSWDHSKSCPAKIEKTIELAEFLEVPIETLFCEEVIERMEQRYGPIGESRRSRRKWRT